jgi:uroporphyrinogen-III synthase
LKIKKILVSQAEPDNEKSPYRYLASKNNIKIDFRPFISVEGVNAKDFRKAKINLLEHQGVIFTSKTAVDHFFRVSKEMRLEIPDTMKYFCTNESTALYLQKYIIYRKRKIFHGNSRLEDLLDVLMKHKEDRFLVPLSDSHKDDIPKFLEKHKLKYSTAILYKTVYSDLLDLAQAEYDILVFYSPSGVKSLLHNFPDFKQEEMKIATFGANTAEAIKEAGLRLDIEAPTPKVPSMTMALELFIQRFNKDCKKK